MQVLECRLVLDPRTRESRGFGFVTMDRLEDAERCIKYLNRSTLEGRVITVEKVGLSHRLGNSVLIMFVVVVTDVDSCCDRHVHNEEKVDLLVANGIVDPFGHPEFSAPFCANIPPVFSHCIGNIASVSICQTVASWLISEGRAGQQLFAVIS